MEISVIEYAKILKKRLLEIEHNINKLNSKIEMNRLSGVDPKAQEKSLKNLLLKKENLTERLTISRIPEKLPFFEMVIEKALLKNDQQLKLLNNELKIMMKNLEAAFDSCLKIASQIHHTDSF